MDSRSQNDNILKLKLKKVLSSLTITYYSVFGAAFLSALAGYYILQHSMNIDSLSKAGITLSSILIIYIIGSIPVTLAYFNRILKKIRLGEDTEYKLMEYKKYGFLRIVIIGVGFVLGIQFFYILHSQSMIFCAGIAAIALVFCKPSEIKIITDLNLENEDI